MQQVFVPCLFTRNVDTPCFEGNVNEHTIDKMFGELDARRHAGRKCPRGNNLEQGCGTHFAFDLLFME